MRILGIVSMVLFSFAFVPQIIVILRTKNVSGISLWLWIMVVSGYVTGLSYMIYLRDPIVIATYVIGLVLALLTMALVVRYRLTEK